MAGRICVDVVERVEDPEDVDAGRRGLLDERVGHLGRVRRVADGVAAAQQHLQADVRHGLAQRGQPLPRVLGEEAQRDVVGGAAPALQRQQLRASVRATQGATASRSLVRTRVASSDWWASRNVVSVTADGRLLRPQPARRSPPGPSSASRCREPAAAGRRQVDGGQLVDRVDQLGRPRPCGRLTVDVGEVGQQPGAAVGGLPRRSAGAGAPR